MSVVHPNVNKTTIQISNNPQFPSIPTKWTDRFDVRIWNELESVCNSALAEIASHKKKRTCTVILVSTWTIFFILANICIGVYAGTGEEYCCYTSQYGCQEYCVEENWGAFISSMVFYGLSGCICFFICPCGIYYDFCYQKSQTQQASPSPSMPPHGNMSLEDKAQMHFNSLNEKYQNMIVFKIVSVHPPSTGCCSCCASPNHQANTTYFELEIEMKVQQITYIPDGQASLPTQQEVLQVNALPTQQQIQTVGSQQQIQMVNSLPIATETQIQQGFQQKHYTQWNTNDVLDWIVQLDNGQFAMYQHRLVETLNAEQIDGNDLCDLDKDDLHRLGIQNFKLKKSLSAHIQSLSQPAPVYQESYGLAVVPSAPGDYNEIDMEQNVSEGAITHS